MSQVAGSGTCSPPPTVLEQRAVEATGIRKRRIRRTSNFSVPTAWRARPPERVPVLRGAHQLAGRRHVLARALELLVPEPHALVGFGRIVGSEIEAPNMLAILV